MYVMLSVVQQANKHFVDRVHICKLTIFCMHSHVDRSYGTRHLTYICTTVYDVGIQGPTPRAKMKFEGCFSKSKVYKYGCQIQISRHSAEHQTYVQAPGRYQDTFGYCPNIQWKSGLIWRLSGSWDTHLAVCLDTHPHGQTHSRCMDSSIHPCRHLSDVMAHNRTPRYSAHLWTHLDNYQTSPHASRHLVDVWALMQISWHLAYFHEMSTNQTAVQTLIRHLDVSEHLSDCPEIPLNINIWI